MSSSDPKPPSVKEKTTTKGEQTNGGQNREGGGGGGSSNKRKNRNRNHHGENKDKQQTQQQDVGKDNNLSEADKKKRPDVQHYKPGAFNSRRTDDGDKEEGGNKEEKPKEKQHNKGRGGKGKKNNNNQQEKHNDVNETAQKLENVQLGDEGGAKAEGGEGQKGGGGGGGRKKKKPEQARYVPKKSDEKDKPEAQAEEGAPQKEEGGGKKDKEGGGGRNKRKGKKDRAKEQQQNAANQDQPDKERKEPQSKGGKGGQDNKAKAKDNNSGQQQQGSSNTESRQQNGFATPAEQQTNANRHQDQHNKSQRDHNRRQQDSDRGNSFQGQQQQPRRNDEHLPPRMRNKEQQREDHSHRGGRREFKRGGGRGGGGGRAASPPRGGKPDSRRNSPAGRQNHSRPTSPFREPQSSRFQQPKHHQPHNNPPRSHRDSGTMSPAPPSREHSGFRSPSPRGPPIHSLRRSHSPNDGGHIPGVIFRRGGGGPRGGPRGGRGGHDWGNGGRSFREASQDRDYYGDNYNRWDDRRDRDMRGKPPSGRMMQQQQQHPKPSLPPRFQRAKEQQMKSDTEGNNGSNMNYYDPPEPFRHNRAGDNNRSWRGDDNYNPRPRPTPSTNKPVVQSQPPSSASDFRAGGGDLRRSVSPTPPPRSLSPQRESLLSDWSVEVDEEEERQEMRRTSVDRDSSSSHSNRSSVPHNVGGILRLPPQSQDQRGHRGGSQYDSNPAWRGMPADTVQAHMQRMGGSGGQAGFWDQRDSGNQRFLFDPKNPNKPIPASNRPPLGNNGDGMMNRFPVDPRFNHPRMPPPHHGGGGGGAGGGPMYRPPFPGAFGNNHNGPRPPMNASGPPSVPEWYHPQFYEKNSRYDSNVASFIARNDIILRKIVSDGGGKLLCQLWKKDVADSRRNIQQAFEHLLKTDLIFCAEYDVEFHIWKIAFYSLVEVLRQGLKEDNPEIKQTCQRNITELLEEGIEFYAQMLDTLDTTYKLDLDTYYDVLEPRPTDKSIKCALMSAQKCLLCLGDLARYRESINETSNFGKARQYYQKASNIQPRNGRPFNQLAILAMNTKRKFEAVYYNMRCLLSKNPFPSSHESLTVIFEDVKKKWEASEKRRLEEKEQKRRHNERDKEGSLTKGTRLRKEIWIKPDGGRRLHRTTSAHEADGDTEENELRDMTTTDLNRRFNNTFLYLIGKLFTRINMDAFPLALDLLRKEFRVLVSRSPLPIDVKRLVQIMALNMFAIEHTKMKGGDSDNYRSAMQDSALQLAFEMFGILVERCNVLLQGFRPVLELTSQCIFPEEDLPTLLSAVKVWCDWLLGNNDTWYPVVTEEPFTQLARLATHLEKLKPMIKPVLSKLISSEQVESRPDANSYELVKLGEDALLCGFDPWFRGLDWSSYRRFAPRSVPSGLAQDARRLDAVNYCIDFLEGLEPPILKWSPPDNAHISLVEKESGNNLSKMLSSAKEQQRDILDESYSDDDLSSFSGPSSTASSVHGQPIDSKLSKLKHRKDELERKRMEEEREAKRMQRQIIQEHVSLTIEIRPRYIIPDTNCFVDFLSEIRQLANCNTYQLRVPLIVLNELDGLAKGAKKPSQYPSQEHASMVQENARRALSYLRDRPPNTKCMTSKGTVLPSLAVTTEEDCEDGAKKNDDLILDACLSLVNVGAGGAHAAAASSGGGKMKTIFRDVVLLTEDRNLKLKAHVSDIPVNKLNDFVRWAFAASNNAGGQN